MVRVWDRLLHGSGDLLKMDHLAILKVLSLAVAHQRGFLCTNAHV